MSFLARIATSVIIWLLEKTFFAAKRWWNDRQARIAEAKKAKADAEAVQVMIEKANTTEEKINAARENARANGPSE